MSAFTTSVEEGIAVVSFDLPGEPVNKLSNAVRVEFEALLIRLRDDPEVQGVVIIEAAAAGVPTVAYDVEGVRDAVVDGETGILAGDDEAFVDAWVQLATDDARRARMAEAGAARAAMFTWDATVDRFESVVRDAVARGRTA